MTQTLAELNARVRAQKTDNPTLYGKVDFDHVPERFTTDPRVKSLLPEPFASKYRGRILAQTDRIERTRAYTMLGDDVADAYAALIPTHGFKKLVDMLVLACERGVD